MSKRMPKTPPRRPDAVHRTDTLTPCPQASHTRVAAEQLIGRHAAEHDGARLRRVDRPRHTRDAHRLEQAEERVAAGHRHVGHAVPDLPIRHAGADGVDLADRVVAEGERRLLFEVGILPLAENHVGELDAGGECADPDLPWPRGGQRLTAHHLKLLGPAKGLQHDPCVRRCLRCPPAPSPFVSTICAFSCPSGPLSNERGSRHQAQRCHPTNVPGS